METKHMDDIDTHLLALDRWWALAYKHRNLDVEEITILADLHRRGVAGWR